MCDSLFIEEMTRRGDPLPEKVQHDNDGDNNNDNDKSEDCTASTNSYYNNIYIYIYKDGKKSTSEAADPA